MLNNYNYAPEVVKLGHVCLISEDVEKSLWFFKEVIGLELVESQDDTHYLKAWGDFEHHSLIIKAGNKSCVEHIAWKVKRKEDLQKFEEVFKQLSISYEWKEDVESGQGKSIRFKIPSGHTFELYFDMEKPKFNDGTQSVLKNQSQKGWQRGISVRRLDHVNIVSNSNLEPNLKFLTDVLGFNLREYLVEPETNQKLGIWLSVTNLVHDLALMHEPVAPSQQEFHHISYWVDNAQDLLRAADILAENNVQFAGPGKHGISQAMYTYVIDPGSGIRVELFSNGYLIFEPDWEPIEWNLKDDAIALTYWGQNTAQAPRHTIPAL